MSSIRLGLIGCGGMARSHVSRFNRLSSRLRLTAMATHRREELERAIGVGARIAARRGGQPLTAPEEVIRQAREERDAQLTGLR